MGMSAPFYSAEMVLALPADGNRYETVHGELLVTPAPRPAHQRVLSELFAAIHAYLQREPVGRAFFAPADLSWAPDLLVQPDLFVVPPEQAGITAWAHVSRLLLAVEVVSPSTRRADRFTKRRLYQAQGVPLYWVIDPDRRLAEVWTPEARFPVTVTDRLEWRPAGTADPFGVPLARLLDPA
jgi:Uma2 family endonuclease